MYQSTYDPCLLYCNDHDAGTFGIVGLQTDDTLFLANTAFAELKQEKVEKAKFLTKLRKYLTTDHLIKFNGGVIRQTGYIITLTQERQYKNHASKQPATLSLDTVGCCRVLLGTIGCCWVLLGAVGY